ncbi:hypothetical protein NDN08_002390 [Rhodosorus marinus]|uniref:BZIP domain-containing protein n=1 Tax=Rhodosorus marinus TaxID=101924 RepID=A0AAV8UXU4_9RHOD|nr:hypothetical protein NDN08_002390 [Rhodosorus marinus]
MAMNGNLKVPACYSLPYPEHRAFQVRGVPGLQIDPMVEQHVMGGSRKWEEFGFPDSPTSYVSTSSVGEMALGVSPSGFREDGRSILKPSEADGGPTQGVELLLGVAALAEDNLMFKKEKELTEPRRKRGRRPTPGMTPEERRTHRLMKNRRTAEISRQRKLEQTKSLQLENESLKKEVSELKAKISLLQRRMRESTDRTTTKPRTVKTEGSIVDIQMN